LKHEKSMLFLVREREILLGLEILFLLGKDDIYCIVINELGAGRKCSR